MGAVGPLIQLGRLRMLLYIHRGQGAFPCTVHAHQAHIIHSHSPSDAAASDAQVCPSVTSALVHHILSGSALTSHQSVVVCSYLVCSSLAAPTANRQQVVSVHAYGSSPQDMQHAMHQGVRHSVCMLACSSSHSSHHELHTTPGDKAASCICMKMHMHTPHTQRHHLPHTPRHTGSAHL
jgi:hypothetical protein